MFSRVCVGFLQLPPTVQSHADWGWRLEIVWAIGCLSLYLNPVTCTGCTPPALLINQDYCPDKCEILFSEYPVFNLRKTSRTDTILSLSFYNAFLQHWTWSDIQLKRSISSVRYSLQTQVHCTEHRSRCPCPKRGGWVRWGGRCQVRGGWRIRRHERREQAVWVCSEQVRQRKVGKQNTKQQRTKQSNSKYKKNTCKVTHWSHTLTADSHHQCLWADDRVKREWKAGFIFTAGLIVYGKQGCGKEKEVEEEEEEEEARLNQVTRRQDWRLMNHACHTLNNMETHKEEQTDTRGNTGEHWGHGHSHYRGNDT